MLEKPAHIVFILDHLDPTKGGVYALVRWTICMLRRCQETEHVSITVTSLKQRKEIKCDDDYVKFAEDYNLATLLPSKFSYPLRNNENNLSCHDLNYHDRQYFRILRDEGGNVLKDVSHIVVCFELTDESVLDNGLVSRIAKISSANNAKVVLLANTQDISYSDGYKTSEMFTKVHTIVCVGTRMYEKWSSSHVEAKYKTIRLFPTFDEFMIEPNRYLANKNFIVLTFYSPHIHVEDFLEHVAVGLGHCMNTFNEDEHKQVEWYIQWSYEELETNKRFENEERLSNLTHSKRVSVKIVSRTGVMKDKLQACSLCIQPGFMDATGFSGLEILLGGTPTLVLPGSDVHEIICLIEEDTTLEPGSQFIFRTPKRKGSVEPDRAADNIVNRLRKPKISLQLTLQFQRHYCKKKFRSSELGCDVPTEDSTLTSIQSYLELLTDKSHKIGINTLEQKAIPQIEKESRDIFSQYRGSAFDSDVKRQEASGPLSSYIDLRQEHCDDTELKQPINPTNLLHGVTEISNISTDDAKMHSVNIATPAYQNVYQHKWKDNAPEAITRTELGAEAPYTQKVSLERKEFAKPQSKSSESREIGIGAKRKTLAEFLSTYDPDDYKDMPRDQHNYKLEVIAPIDPTGRRQRNEDQDDI